MGLMEANERITLWNKNEKFKDYANILLVYLAQFNGMFDLDGLRLSLKLTVDDETVTLTDISQVRKTTPEENTAFDDDEEDDEDDEDSYDPAKEAAALQAMMSKYNILLEHQEFADLVRKIPDAQYVKLSMNFNFSRDYTFIPVDIARSAWGIQFSTLKSLPQLSYLLYGFHFWLSILPEDGSDADVIHYAVTGYDPEAPYDYRFEYNEEGQIQPKPVDFSVLDLSDQWNLNICQVFAPLCSEAGVDPQYFRGAHEIMKPYAEKFEAEWKNTYVIIDADYEDKCKDQDLFLQSEHADVDRSAINDILALMQELTDYFHTLPEEMQKPNCSPYLYCIARGCNLDCSLMITFDTTDGQIKITNYSF